MTVRQLIDFLAKCGDEDAEVVVPSWNRGYARATATFTSAISNRKAIREDDGQVVYSDGDHLIDVLVIE